jgi:hypothetical protein
LSITLHYRAQIPSYPPINIKEEARLARLVAEKLRASIPELKKWGIGQQAAYQWSEGPNVYHAVAFIQRLTTFDSGKAASLEFSGNFPHFDAHLVLTHAIEKKLAKNYSTFPNGRFWLLAYGDEPFLVEDDAVAHAKSLIKSYMQHPFDEVWAFFSYAAQELGFPRRVGHETGTFEFVWKQEVQTSVSQRAAAELFGECLGVLMTRRRYGRHRSAE